MRFGDVFDNGQPQTLTLLLVFFAIELHVCTHTLDLLNRHAAPSIGYCQGKDVCVVHGAADGHGRPAVGVPEGVIEQLFDDFLEIRRSDLWNRIAQFQAQISGPAGFDYRLEAHLDHLGLNPELMPGANDNASGVAVLLGAAQALDFRTFTPGAGTQKAREVIRRHVAHLEVDRPLFDDHNAMKALVKSGEVGHALAVGADTSQGAPGDALEYSTAAGAAAFIFGTADLVATLDAQVSYMTDTPDFWRREYMHYPRHAGRYTGEPAYFKHTLGAAHMLLEKTSLKPADFAFADGHAENLARHRFGFLRRIGELDATGLAASAGRHLGLDHARADLRRCCSRIFRTQAQNAARHRNAGGRQDQRFRRVFFEVHGFALRMNLSENRFPLFGFMRYLPYFAQ